VSRLWDDQASHEQCTCSFSCRPFFCHAQIKPCDHMSPRDPPVLKEVSAALPSCSPSNTVESELNKAMFPSCAALSINCTYRKCPPSTVLLASALILLLFVLQISPTGDQVRSFLVPRQPLSVSKTCESVITPISTSAVSSTMLTSVLTSELSKAQAATTCTLKSQSAFVHRQL